MKKIIFYTIIMLGLLNSCTKSAPSPTSGTSALTIVNAIPNSNPILTNFLSSNGNKATDSFIWYNFEYQNSGGIPYGSSEELGSYTGLTNLSIVQISDTFRTIFNGVFNLRPEGIYSFYLTGSDTLHVDTLFIMDSIPYYPTTSDSVTGVRFINLVAGSNPIVVTLQSDTAHTRIGNPLVYKSVSLFQPFAANTSAQQSGYSFEFRDASSNVVLATYNINIVPFKSQTLAFYGSVSTGLSVMEINNY